MRAAIWRQMALAGAALAAGLNLSQATGRAAEKATVALISLDGGPPTAREDFRRALLREFAQRDVQTAAPAKARYLVQAHLAALADGEGAELDYVLDLYDARQTRVARLSDAFTLDGQGDPWSRATTQALDVIAAKCADDLAALVAGGAVAGDAAR